MPSVNSKSLLYDDDITTTTTMYFEPQFERIGNAEFESQRKRGSNSTFVPNQAEFDHFYW